MTANEARDLCTEIIDMIDDDIDTKARNIAGDFFEDVREKVVEVQATIESSDMVTERQEAALENWHAGVAKWIH